MACDILHPACALAVGERKAKLGRSALRGGDTGHHVDRDVRLLACGNFLGGAAKNEGIAALEADHAFALPGEAHHQGIDVFLLAGRLEAGLTHEHFSCFAASKIEHLARNQIVEQDHVG